MKMFRTLLLPALLTAGFVAGLASPRVALADGSATLTFPDGTQVTLNPSGTVTVKRAVSGTVITQCEVTGP